MDFQSFVWYIVHFHICCSLDISGTIDGQMQKKDRVKYMYKNMIGILFRYFRRGYPGGK